MFFQPAEDNGLLDYLVDGLLVVVLIGCLPFVLPFWAIGWSVNKAIKAIARRGRA